MTLQVVTAEHDITHSITFEKTISFQRGPEDSLNLNPHAS